MACRNYVGTIQMMGTPGLKRVLCDDGKVREINTYQIARAIVTSARETFMTLTKEQNLLCENATNLAIGVSVVREVHKKLDEFFSARNDRLIALMQKQKAVEANEKFFEVEALVKELGIEVRESPENEHHIRSFTKEL